jgi:hypothetical protein
LGVSKKVKKPSVASTHTGRELELMLAGDKPLAMFCAEISELPEELFIPEAAFAVHVKSGRFVRRELIVEGHSWRNSEGMSC